MRAAGVLFAVALAATASPLEPKKGPGAAQTAAAEPSPEQESMQQLAGVRRIFVDVLTGGESAAQLREMLISGLQTTRLFVITEDEHKADAVLRGAGKDQVYTDFHQSSDSINAHSQLSLPGTTSSSSSRSNRSYTSFGVGENENSRIEERKHEAVATVRLVTKDGDVIWATTQESTGAKFMGASADVVDKITKKLAADYQRACAKPAK